MFRFTSMCRLGNVFYKGNTESNSGIHTNPTPNTGNNTATARVNDKRDIVYGEGAAESAASSSGASEVNSIAKELGMSLQDTAKSERLKEAKDAKMQPAKAASMSQSLTAQEVKDTVGTPLDPSVKKSPDTPTQGASSVPSQKSAPKSPNMIDRYKQSFGVNEAAEKKANEKVLRDEFFAKKAEDKEILDPHEFDKRYRTYADPVTGETVRNDREANQVLYGDAKPSIKAPRNIVDNNRSIRFNSPESYGSRAKVPIIDGKTVRANDYMSSRKAEKPETNYVTIDEVEDIINGNVSKKETEAAPTREEMYKEYREELSKPFEELARLKQRLVEFEDNPNLPRGVIERRIKKLEDNIANYDPALTETISDMLYEAGIQHKKSNITVDNLVELVNKLHSEQTAKSEDAKYIFDKSNPQMTPDDFAEDPDPQKCIASNRRSVLQRIRAAYHMIYLWKNPEKIILECEKISQDKYDNKIFDKSEITDELALAAIEDVRRYMPNIPITFIKKMALARMGIGVDQNGMIANTPWEKWKMPTDVFVQACAEMCQSIQLYGHPFAVISDFQYAGTRCFPIGFIPIMDCTYISKYANNDFWGWDVNPAELQNKIADEWVQVTLPSIKLNAKPGQLSAIYNNMRAMMDLDDVSYDKFGVPSDIEASLSDTQEYNNQFAKLNPEMEGSTKRVNQYIDDCKRKIRHDQKRDASKRWGKRVQHKFSGNFNDDDDSGIWEPRVGKGRVGQFFMGWANWQRFAGVVGSAPLIASAYAEKFQGTYYEWLGNKFLGWGYTKNEDAELFKLSPEGKAFTRTHECKEIMRIIDMLFNAQGKELIEIFAYEVQQGNRSITAASCQEFIDEWINNIPDKRLRDKKRSNFAKWKKDAGDFIKNSSEALLPAAAGTRGFDSRRYLESFMINQAIRKKKGLSYYTAEDVEKAMQEGGIGQLLIDSVATDAGWDAFLACSNQSLGRRSPLAHRIEKFMRSNGITNFVITNALDKYVVYGVNYMQLFIPMSNTVSFCVERGIAKVRKSVGLEAQEALDYQMGGHDDFSVGFMKNFVYDMVRFGNTALQMFAQAAIFLALGMFDEPPEDKYNWKEWLKFFPSWALNDLSMWSTPAAVAFALMIKYPDQPDLSCNVFKQGLYTMVEGTSVMDTLKLITNVDKNLSDIQESMENDEWLAPPDWNSFGQMIFVGFCLNAVKNSTPSVLINLQNDNMYPTADGMTHSAALVWDTRYVDLETAKEKNLTRYLTSEEWAEYNLRKWLKYNPTMGLFFDVLSDIGLHDNKGTGYLYNEMPVAKHADEAMSFWLDKFEYDENEAANSGNSDVYDMNHAHDMVNELEQQFGTDSAAPTRFIAYGGCISLENRIKAKNALYKEIYAVETNFNELPYMASPEYQSRELSKKQYVNYLYDIINKWFDNEAIPYSADSYQLTSTDYNKMYFNNETGEQVTGIDMLLNPKGTTEVVKPAGNTPTNYALGTGINNQGWTDKDGNYHENYNSETGASWFNPEVTDLEKMKEIFGDSTVRIGSNAGVKLTDLYLAGDADSPIAKQGQSTTDTKIQQGESPTINMRSYVSTRRSLPKEITDITYESVNGEKYSTTKSKTSSSGSSSGSGYSGSGSGYSPKIYSNPHSVNSDRASGMGSTKLYGTNNNTYLRPSFSTSGSRNAWKRSE